MRNYDIDQDSKQERHNRLAARHKAKKEAPIAEIVPAEAPAGHMRHEILGGKTSAVIYGNYPDAEELKQIYAMLESDAFAGAKVRIMPDHHAGKGCVVGFTMPLDLANLKVVPNLVGVDIGCGVQAVQLPSSAIFSNKSDFEAFDQHLRATVPAGFNDRDVPHPDLEAIWGQYIKPDLRQSWVDFKGAINALVAKIGADESKVWRSCGTLGGGNHFIEIDKATDGSKFLTVHSGSRNFGLKVAGYHQRIAAKGSRNELSYLEGEEAASYLQDMQLAQRFALLSRYTMLHCLLDYFGLRLHEKALLPRVLSIHNFIGEDDRTVRKGAISAKNGETVLIPWNMEDGIIIGRGKGNPDWNNSAPHGSGRQMSRGQAKKRLTVEDFQKGMEDANVWSSCVGKDTLDEAKGAYKPTAEIIAAIGDTVEILLQLKPIYNFKAG